MNFPILSSLILLPSIGALFLMFAKEKSNETSNAIKYVALFASFLLIKPGNLSSFAIEASLCYLFLTSGPIPLSSQNSPLFIFTLLDCSKSLNLPVNSATAC